MKVGVELRKKANDKSIGILNLRVVNNGKRKYKSLKIDLPKKYWDSKKQKVKSNYPHSKAINKDLEVEVLRIKNEGVGVNYKQPVIYIFDKYLKRYKASTRLNYSKNLNKFKEFLQTRNLSNIYLDDINNDLFRDYKDYLLTPKNHTRPIGQNTANTNFQILKSLLSKAVDDGLVYYNRDPFRKIKFKKIPPKKDYLSIDHLAILIKAKLNKFDDIARQLFVFQVFSQGMRISDVLLLRYKDIKFDDDYGSLEYVQSKSKTRINMRLNSMQFRVLNLMLSTYDKDVEVITLNKDINNLKESLKLLRYQKNNIIQPEIKKFDSMLLDLPVDDRVDLGKLDFRTIDDKIENIKKEIQKKNAEILKYKFSKKDPDTKIFYFNYRLEGTGGGIDLTMWQYKAIETLRGTVNQRLKRISKNLNIKHISTHIARHTFAMLNVNSGLSIDDLSKALGHKSLEVTRNYISEFPTNRLNKKVGDFADRF